MGGWTVRWAILYETFFKAGDHILRKGRAWFAEATHLVDLLPVSLNMLCSLLKQRFPCCPSPPWGHPASFYCLCGFSPSCEAHLKGQLLPGTFPKNPSPHWPLGFCIPSIIAISLHSLTLCSLLLCGVSSGWVCWGGRMGSLCVSFFIG